jgi:hypothetical protein
MPPRETKPPIGDEEWWQIVIGFSPPGRNVDYAKQQLRLRNGHIGTDPSFIRDYYTRLYERNPSYLRAIVNTVNPKTQACVFPKLSKAMQARVQAGTKPVEFFNEELTRAEAHDALMNGYVMALPYLMRNVYRILGGSNVRDCTVARWLDAVCKDPERLELLRRERVVLNRGGGGGRPYEYRDSYIRHIEDLRAEDFPNGLKTGVRRAFERSEARRAQVLADEEARAARYEGGRTEASKPVVDLIPEWYIPFEGVELLTSRADLDEEGHQMHHCVGSYAGYVMRGDCSILRIRVGKHKSTAEVRYDLDFDVAVGPLGTPIPRARKNGIRVVQHKGPCNASPAAANTARLYQAIEFWHKALDDRAKMLTAEPVAVPQTEAVAK